MAVLFMPGLTIGTTSDSLRMWEFTEAELAQFYDPKNYENEFVPGEVIVGMKYGVAPTRNPMALFPELDIASIVDANQSVRDAFDMVYAKASQDSKKSLESSRAAWEASLRTEYLIKLPLDTKESVLDAIEVLKRNPDVAYVQPNYISYPEASPPNNQYPNDQYYDELWGMERVYAPEAWDITTGNCSVEVGVLDSGFDWEHPDLEDNIDRSRAYYPAQNTIGSDAALILRYLVRLESNLTLSSN